MKVKLVFRYDPGQKKVKLFRLLRTCGKVGSGGYSEKFAVAIRPILFRWQRDFHECRLVLLGMDFHYRRSYGGVFV